MSLLEVQLASDTRASPATSAMIFRSCDRCRHRKVKCDRAHPCCSNCSQADAACVYPPGKGRAPKRPRGIPDSQLVERLSRLENIIRQAGTPGPTGQQTATGASLDGSFGRLMIDETSSYYVNNVLWSTLANEVEELRDLLLDPASEDESDQVASTPGGSQANKPPPPLSREGSNAAILRYRGAALAQSLHRFHPSLPQAVALFAAFVENVAPLVRIFHMPSLTRDYWDAIGSLESIDRNTEALLFAIHYAAVISIDSSQCVNVLGATRETALDRSRFAVEQALARADLLNTQSLKVVQATVIFLTALRNQDESRTTWSLTSLIYHIAQAMGLHRDGEAFGLKPFETELRRRLWWHICILDSRSSEYHGYEPIVQEFAFDTKAPLHINDTDLLPEMTERPTERWNEATDMTFTLLRCEAMRAGWKLGVKSRRTSPGSAGEGVTHEERELQLKQLKHTLQERFVRHCDKSASPFHRFVSAAVARLIIARFWLVLHYPTTVSAEKENMDEKVLGQAVKSPRTTSSTESSTGPVDTSMRDRLFQASIQILEISGRLLTDPQISRWAWYSKTHIQWAAVAFVLSELCSRPASADCDRAWAVVNIVYDAWKMKQDDGRGIFSLPIQRLMLKARYVREMSHAARLGTSTSNFDQHEQRHSVQANEWPDPAAMAATTAFTGGVDLSQGQRGTTLQTPGVFPTPESCWPDDYHDADQMVGVLGTESLDTFMDLMPNNFHAPNSWVSCNEPFPADNEVSPQRYWPAENLGQASGWETW